MVRVILKEKNFLVRLWVESLNIACYTHNRVYLHLGTTMTPYEVWRGKKPNLKYFHEFNSTCFVLNDKEHKCKFDAKMIKEYF